MSPRVHLAASFTIGSLLYLYFYSFQSALMAFACGVLIDLDHCLDYLLIYRNADIKRFFDTYALISSAPLVKRCYLWLHSIEGLFLFWFLINEFSLGILWVSAAIGFTQHIALDYIFNTRYAKPHFYFLVFRALNGFDRRRLFKNTHA
ncbi:MAG: hypothetical protein COV72_06900 [Candidatus Omnitrophica bacterium CG11_big_fil_rev_8_21_14_0_20_42_13]|uniref:Metal-dependent hydrolase n=1 Tax=Candidatus Ghiorseimicrobium undicola TaxID=1974746 RepID=A0A2H0LW59_9BACT|nr:MAG: hypothetical protein COV72_06900 [Candidatus Omnitrophica bacterium CG11_big_fil_rev_8_21_14_0_20_42_13]